MNQPHLLYGDERVLWEGAPPTGLRFQARDVFVVPFTLLWAGFAIFWNALAWIQGENWFFRLWGLPFLLIGVYIPVGRFVHEAWVRNRLRYRVTDRRVIVERIGWHGDIRSLAIDWLPLIAMTERVDGSGDLRFELKRYDRGKGGRLVERDRDAPALSPVVQFLGIPDVAAVRDLIERTARVRETRA